ncbi:MAG: hypothetical protein D6785_13055 [Planctomycetota bacterium]|nr:MAG: hypothetical protein D6785_13055 [Planctomycetota bacterium]
MAWPFKKNKDDSSKRKKFSSLNQNKLGSKRLPKKLQKKVEPVKEEVPVEEEFEEFAEPVPFEEDFEENLEEFQESLMEDPTKINLDDEKEDLEDMEELEPMDDLGDLDDVDELSLDDEEKDEDEEVIPSNQRMGTMRIPRKAMVPPNPKGTVPMGALSGPAPALREDQKKLARALIAGGGITVEEIEAELDRSGKKEGVLGKALLNTGYAKLEKLYAALLSRYRIPRLNIQNTKIPRATIQLIPAHLAHEWRVIPIEKIGNILCVAMDNIYNEKSIVAVRHHTGCKIVVLQCSPEGMELTLKRYYPDPTPPKAQEEVALSSPSAPKTPSVQPSPSPSNGVVVRAIPLSQVPSCQPLQGRYFNVKDHWIHIHVKGERVVPEEAKL